MRPDPSKVRNWYELNCGVWKQKQAKASNKNIIALRRAPKFDIERREREREWERGLDFGFTQSPPPLLLSHWRGKETTLNNAPLWLGHWERELDDNTDLLRVVLRPRDDMTLVRKLTRKISGFGGVFLILIWATSFRVALHTPLCC